MSGIEVVSRRGFIGTVFTAGALVLGTRVLPGQSAPATGAAFQPNLWIGVQPDNTIILLAHRSEMGTGIRTSLPMILADEMDADWKSVRIEQAIGDARLGSQDTDGSCSIRDFYETMREAGASARLMLERAAAQKWGVPASECIARNHAVGHTGSDRSATYGQLATLAAQQPVPKKEDLRFKKDSEFRYIGKGVPLTDLNALVTGKAVFGMDARMPGMVFASIERPPVLEGSLRSFDDSLAKQVPGVLGAYEIKGTKPPHGFNPLGGVAVIASNTWTANQARKKLKIDWDLGPNAGFQSDAYKKQLQETARTPGKVVRNVGDVDAAFKGADKIIEAEYYTPLLAHASMEPPAAVAEFKDGKVIAYACTQDPQGVQATVAAAVGIKPEDVTCHVTLLGGAFGRKSKPDFVAEAAILSKQVGKPVKVVWSREDDIRFDYYHAVAAMYMKAAVDAKGKPVAWLQRSVFPPIGSTFVAGDKWGSDGELAMGWTDVPFEIPNHRAENGPAENHVRIGWLRSVANIYHAFGVQSFVDELAHNAGRDPIEYTLELLGSNRKLDVTKQGAKYPNYGKSMETYSFDIDRLRRTIETVADKSGWAKGKSGNGTGWGFAAHRSFLTDIAVVVKLDVDAKGQVKIPEVHIAVDAGQFINPDRVRAQFEGAAVFGTSVAMMGEISLADGRVHQSNFDTYPVARMHEAPLKTHVHLIAGGGPPTGVGEPGVPPMVPAITNAIFAATGKRVRDLPVNKMKLV